MQQHEIKINPEYQNLVSDLSDEEYQSLKESIKENGLFVPIIVNQNGVILDGHHRYKIYNQELKQPIPLDKIEVKYFDDPLYERLFVIDVNLSRRHLNDYQKSKLVLKRKPVLEEIVKQNSESTIPEKGEKGFQSTSSKNLRLIGKEEGVNELLGEQVGVSKETIRKVEFIEEKATEEQKQKLERDEVSIDRVFKELDGKQKLEQLERKKEVGESLTDEEIMRSLGISIRPYDVWNFSGLDNRFGMKYPGQIPADIVFNSLFLYKAG